MTEPSQELVEEIARVIYGTDPSTMNWPSWPHCPEGDDKETYRAMARAVLSSASIAKMRTDAYVEGENAARAFLLGAKP